MGTRAGELADRLEDSADQIITTVEDLSEEDWARVTPGDGRQINVLVHHVAQSLEAVYLLVDMILAERRLPPLTMDIIHASNAQHAVENVQVTKETALVALRYVAESCAAKLRELQDADLDRSAPFSLSPTGSISIEGVVQHLMIDHANTHLETIQLAIA